MDQNFVAVWNRSKVKIKGDKRDMTKGTTGRNDKCPCESGRKYKVCCMEQIKRKYMAEFGLLTYSSHATILYPHDLYDYSNDHQYHIYMIHQIPKLSFIPDSLNVSRDNIQIEVRVRTEVSDEIKIFNFKVKNNLDHSQLNISFDGPAKSIKITNDKGHGSIIRILPFFLNYTKYELDYEILYIGQSFGRTGDRTAKQRLLSHSTLQEIQSNHLFNEPIGDIVLSLWEFTPRLLTSFDGTSKEFETSKEVDMQHMAEVLKAESLKLHSHMINITEAALINYFKPEYNEKFKNNFPDIGHVGYKHYYDLDYNSIIVEFDLDTINGKLFSKQEEYSSFNAIQYPLHSEEVRKSMFDYFN